MSKRKLIVYSDFICPFCYIGKVNAEKVKEAFPDLEVEWREYELHSEGDPVPDRAYLEQAVQMVRNLADQYGIKMNPEVILEVTTSSRKALLGFLHAKEHGQGEAYRDAVFEAYWLQKRDIGDLAVLKEIAGEVGLDTEAFARDIEAETHLPQLKEEQKEAQARGISGVPTYIYGEMQTVGAQPPDVLKRMIHTQNEKDDLEQISGVSCGPEGCN